MKQMLISTSSGSCSTCVDTYTMHVKYKSAAFTTAGPGNTEWLSGGAALKDASNAAAAAAVCFLLFTKLQMLLNYHQSWAIAIQSLGNTECGIDSKF